MSRDPVKRRASQARCNASEKFDFSPGRGYDLREVGRDLAVLLDQPSLGHPVVPR